MLIKYQLRKKEVKRKILRKIVRKNKLYIIDIQGRRTSVSRLRCCVPEPDTSEWVVIYVYEYHLHSVGCTVAVYFHCYAFCISCMLWLIIFDYHWFSSRYQIGLDCIRIFILFRSILESCLTYWGRYTNINDLTTA